MNRKLALTIICFGSVVTLKPFPLQASDMALPSGFEDIFTARQNGIFDVIYGDVSIGSHSAEYDQKDVLLLSPQNIVEQLTATDMPALTIESKQLLKLLSAPIKRVNKGVLAHQDIVAWLNYSDATLHLILPAALFKSPNLANDRTYILHKSQPGFVHSHNLNFLSDNYGDSFSIASNDTLNLTGNSYIKGAWSYSQNIALNLDELALYLEHDSTRFKAGRQRMNDNLFYSTPSLGYSFFNPLSFDGVSLGYMTDNYLRSSTGASSPVTLYMPLAGTVEVYRNGRLIDLQQFPSGMQQLNTEAWPAGGYDVQLVSKLVNGSREVKSQPFFKRSGMFRSGDLEYALQLGRYDQRQGNLSSLRGNDCIGCGLNNGQNGINNNSLASVTLGYTSQSALSFGGGSLLDNNHLYFNGSLDIPLNLWIAERLYTDALIGNDGSYGYQVGLSKNLNNIGFNLSYRNNRYQGSKSDFRRFSVVPAYDSNYLQLGVSTFLPWNIGLSVTYSMNTLYQEYKKQGQTDYKTWDIALNRDFTLNDNMNLRMDLGYHQGVNEYTRNGLQNTFVDRGKDNRVFAQFTLGMREQSFNHYQSLYLRSRLSDKGSADRFSSADYALDLQNPDFDRGGKYSVTASVNNGPGNQTNGGAGVTVDNALGYTSAGLNRSLGDNNYRQYYLSQRSGFALGEGTYGYGRMDNNTALIVDATELPGDQYFEVRNRDSAPVVVKGGKKTALDIQPYQKVAPSVEQVYTGDASAFYNLTTKSTSTWAMPGQAYKVKITATKNQTVTGRIYFQGAPLPHARVVGGNTLTDEEGLFVGDFTMGINDNLQRLTVKKDQQNYTCPLMQENIRLTQGIMQIREVDCEIQ
ncbi:TcfC E-set like domain-containing protein [Serratia marcescens]|uniref:TcfC E-set like domain-containing protein n=1 Tax=Serratia marcescens TaxID=615 RepID=UPI00034634A2|nr:TcfC E-set like domain-containing protein [Serratia marcescens]